MEPSIAPNIKDMQLLKAATTLLLEHAYNELKDKDIDVVGDNNQGNQKPPKTSIFGHAAPIVTLEGAVRLLIALSRVDENQGPNAPELPLSDADLLLVEGFLHRVRKNDRQQVLLPNPNS